MSLSKRKLLLSAGERPIGDLVLISPYMQTDLHRILKASQILTDEHAHFFLYQTLCALKYIQGAGLLHRDIRPSNLLTNSTLETKLADFSCCRGMEEEMDDFSEYGLTRCYRAPEALMMAGRLTPAVDMWSVGCCFGEVLARRQLFPGTNSVKQVDLILRLLGTPAEEDLEFISNPQVRKFLRSMDPRPSTSLPDYLGGDLNPQAVDLLSRMLVFNPNRRITVNEALRHPYLSDLHDSDEETECREVLDFSFDREDADMREVKQLIQAEIELIRQS